MKFAKVGCLTVLLLLFFGIIVVFEVNCWPAGSSIAGIVLGFIVPALMKSIQDLTDTADWKSSQRKLMRDGKIKKDTIIRISFAYLYRIKIGNKYLLVKNERGTGKYQPVGGVYKMLGDEKIELRNRFQAKDDNKIPIDESSRDDYRLRIENKYLRRFIRRFNFVANREHVSNLSREFREELVSKGIVNWGEISYRYCGRHMTKLKFGEHFQIYELLLADVVELIPNLEQEKDLQKLMMQQSDIYRFVTAEEIKSLGVNTKIGYLTETISDHSNKIIQENDGLLMKVKGVGKMFTVEL